MNYLLDTDTLIYWLKGNKSIEEKALAIGLEQLGYSVISHAELYFGAYNSAQKDKNLLAIHVVSKKLALVDFNAESAQLFQQFPI
jgi:predicted nucleic acid-binding protein